MLMNQKAKPLLVAFRRQEIVTLNQSAKAL